MTVSPRLRFLENKSYLAFSFSLLALCWLVLVVTWQSGAVVGGQPPMVPLTRTHMMTIYWFSHSWSLNRNWPTTMANPFSNPGGGGGGPPSIPERNNKYKEVELEEVDMVERTLMTKEQCLIYKIPPQVKLHTNSSSYLKGIWLQELWAWAWKQRNNICRHRHRDQR